MTCTYQNFILAIVVLGSMMLTSHGVSAQEPSSGTTNVLMICVDDLNDWVQPLGGHPQAQTPAIQRLAESGLNFRNAHCQSPLCNSSRTSVMLSLRPATTGIHGLSPWFRTLPKYRTTKSLPQCFADAGYQTYTAGKVYHNSMGRKPMAGAEPEFQHWGPGGWPGKTPKQKLVPPTPAGNNPWVDWGVFDHEDNEKGDWKVAQWAESTLADMPTEKPFFMAVGFFLPHVPCHVTQKWWDLYPEETLQLPPMQPQERAGCSPFSWYLHWKLPEPRLSWLQHHNEHKNLVRAYLASITFMDHQVGRVLDALNDSPHADNTVVCLWSDHGFHLGEKEMMGKTTLWERSTRVPLIFSGNGIRPGTCDQPVELLDIYPTLADLAGLPVPDSVQGVSLRSLISDPSMQSDRPAITEHNPGNAAIRDQRYRLIHYADGSEELYDMQEDPHEFNNRIDDALLANVRDRLRKYIPNNPVPLADGSGQRILEKRSDGWYWENEKIDPDNPPMGIGSTLKKDLVR